MCGILGYISRNIINENEFRLSLDSLSHRGPDTEGIYKNSIDDVNILLGHKRLSIIDLTEFGRQPMIYNENYIITYNGEIYNYIELRKELTNYGTIFKSYTDTEVILASYEKWGFDCVNRFIGMWSFTILDLKNKLIFSSRDRFGVKPFYYCLHNHSYIFASEIKALFHFKKIRPELNSNSLKDFIIDGKIKDKHATLYKHIKELPAGNYLTIDLRKFNFNIKEYYNLSNIIYFDNTSSEAANIETYRSMLFDSVKIHLRSDVPIGTCLSGGLDSSSLTAIANTLTNIDYNTFTAAYNDANTDESGYARDVSKFLRISKHFFCYPEPDIFWNEYDRFIYHQDMPVASTSMFAQWEVMKLASSTGIKVLLDGQGADESLAGYSIFAGFYLLDILKSLNLLKFFSEKNNLSVNRIININNEIMRALYYKMPFFLRQYMREKGSTGYSILNDKDKKDNMYSKYFGKIKNLQKYSIHSLDYGLKELLRYEDRNSMAFSIESRVPFLDHRLVEYTINLPGNLKFRNGYSKFVLRQSVINILPENIVWRKDKKGFITPQRKWKLVNKRKLIEYFNDTEIPSLINKKVLLELTDKDDQSERDLSDFWKYFSIIKWYNLNKWKN